jgi:hypothetical protein
MEIKYHNECEHCQELFWTKDAWAKFCEDCLTDKEDFKNNCVEPIAL